MHRRTFLAGATGATATVLAGCSTLGIDDDSGGSSGPAAPVESIAAASAANDSAAVETAVHPDGPLADGLPRSVDDRTLSIENTTVASETNGTAVVEANVSVAETGEQWHEPREFEIRERDGEWTAWSMATGPELALREYVEAVDAGDATAATERLHSDSPDAQWVDETVVEAATLSVEELSLAASWPDEATVDATVVETVDGEESSRERSIDLRRTDEGWRVWSLRFGPVVPVYEYVRAINESDAEIFEAALHPDSPTTVNSDDGMLSQIEVESTEGLTVSTIEDGEATVTGEMTLAGFGQTSTTSATFVLRSSDGEWLLYSSG